MSARLFSTDALVDRRLADAPPIPFFKRFIFVTLIVAASCRATTPPPAPGPAADIATLASRAFGGRHPGTPGGDSAADFIMRRYAELRLHPAFRTGCDSAPQCGWSYFQVFRFENTVAQNVGAIIDGADPALRTEYIVIGAHFDALGQADSPIDRRGQLRRRRGRTVRLARVHR